MKNLEIWINENCNLNCEYCTIKNNKVIDKEPNYKQIQHYLDNDLDSESEVYIIGGEPTLSPYLKKIIDMVQQTTTNIIVYTNIVNIYKIYNTNKEQYNILVNLDVDWKLTYHPDQSTLNETVRSIKDMSELNIEFLCVMWQSEFSEKTIKEFQLLKKIYNNKTVNLEPLYFFDKNFKLEMHEFKKFQEQGLCKYSELLTVTNPYNNKQYFEIYNELLYKNKNKICNVMNHWIIYDVNKDIRHTCMTDCVIQKTSNTESRNNPDNCNDECILDLEYITDFGVPND